MHFISMQFDLDNEPEKVKFYYSNSLSFQNSMLVDH